MSFFLLLEDGEMHPAGQIVLARPGEGDDDGDGTLTLTDAIIAPGTDAADALSLGGQILTAEDFGTKDADGNIVTKIEVEKVPVSHFKAARKRGRIFS